jgi:hypothetical protein
MYASRDRFDRIERYWLRGLELRRRLLKGNPPCLMRRDLSLPSCVLFPFSHFQRRFRCGYCCV